MKKIILFICFFITGCSSLFSGEKYYPMIKSDIDSVVALNNYLKFVPDIKQKNGEIENKVIYFLFDGTANDRKKVDYYVERETVVGFLANELEKIGEEIFYIPGPGVNSKIDAIFCFSCEDKAHDAYEELKKIISKKDYEDYRILVIGFSRGAAISKHFMNLVSKEWPATNNKDSISVRIYSVLFDTVAKNMGSNFNLKISTTTDFLMHLIAEDEVRPLFKLVVDKDDSEFSISNGLEIIAKRVLNIYLPGAHSDIGGSYLNGVSEVYRNFSKNILHKMGVLGSSQNKIDSHVWMYGVNDSRGYFDKIIGVIPFYKKEYRIRNSIGKDAEVLDNKEKEIIFKNLIDRVYYSTVTASFYQQINRIDYPEFFIKKLGREYCFSGKSGFILMDDKCFPKENKYIEISYVADTCFESKSSDNCYPSCKVSNFKIPTRILREMKGDSEAVLELAISSKNGGSISFYINGKFTE